MPLPEIIILEEALLRDVWWANQQLYVNDLVSWTSGNVSGRNPKTGYWAIKPSGVRYEILAWQDICLLDMDGNQRPFELEKRNSKLKPSTDIESHLYIYKHCLKVNGICHTHSPYATAFAAAGMDIPCILTAMADEFGNSVFCTKKVSEIGSEAIGKDVVEYLGLGANSGAVLLKSHGVFTVGPSPEAAVKTAVMVEDSARTVWLASQIKPSVLEDQLPLSVINSNFERYRNYGQR